jgi:hypothetical protein
MISYPWERWFRKRRIKLMRGRDYRCMTHCFNVLARAAAKRLNYAVSIRMLEREDGLVIHAGKREDRHA